MADPRDISINHFTYDLPSERIAMHPLPERDASKLLIYRNGQMQEDVYRNIAAYLPEGSLLMFNKTKVINARLRFHKSTGGAIEIFCLEPAGELHEYSTVMNECGHSRWVCFAGNAAKWKEEILIRTIGYDGENEIVLSAKKLVKKGDAYIIEFSWEPQHISFAEILEKAGDIPLPPYIKRQSVNEDKGRYQTIYAEQQGSVAAPTAGLHFTQRIFDDFQAKGINKAFVTLHVGAGTFKPVKASVMAGHDMHAEWIDVDEHAIQQLLMNRGKIIAVGTTSLRTIETLYWLGVKAHIEPSVNHLELRQWDVYEDPLVHAGIDLTTALESLLHWMKTRGRKNLFTQTQLLITPGYKFRVASALVTNFHQPQSTLLLLVAAAAGDDWKKMYEYALANGFRFLSYGDGSLIFMAES